MNVDYTVIYSRRRTIAIKIDNFGNLSVRCPYGMSHGKIERFINSKSAWIEKHLLITDARKNAYADLFAYKKILVSGEEYDLIFTNRDRVDDGKIYITSLKALKALYVKNFAEGFLKRYEHICAKTGLYARSVKFGDFKSLWGCCSAENDVRFNYKLLMLPPNCQTYVIIHELCHTVRHDHSRLFWANVKKYLPEYKQIISEVKEYSFIPVLYNKNG